MHQLPDRYVYPAIFTFEEDGVSVEFPDIDGCFTGGPNLVEATRLARDVLAGCLSIMEEDHESIPAPSDVRLWHGWPLSENQSVMLVEAWMPPYREDYSGKSVSKNVTLPRWLKTAAEEKHVNFSRILQDGLMKELGLEIRSNRKDENAGEVTFIDGH